ncbi:hypothetical protein [Desertivirga arenae]|uniref:hypothetical protein n=1 Tax=Desertivirga arenae TaxID=2810309 RepID=UPI001A964C4B|nr:hypothetical protein [Pedobacter sp. SYSU D00823]
MLSPIQDDVKLIQDECKAILGLDTKGPPSGQVRGKFGKASRIFEEGTPFSRTILEESIVPSAILRKSPQIPVKCRVAF